MIIPTVRIVSPANPGGYTVINKSDFDQNTMEIYVDGRIASKPKPRRGVKRENTAR